MNEVLIILSSNTKDFQIIDILVADIPEFYGLILSRDWSEKLNDYFSTYWSHLWLPYNGKPNLIRIDREKHMKYIVTDLCEENEPIAFSNNILEIYSSMRHKTECNILKPKRQKFQVSLLHNLNILPIVFVCPLEMEQKVQLSIMRT